MNWKKILIECGVKSATAEKWEPFFCELVKPENFSAGFDELDDFLAQILHESGMIERLEENLNYSSAERIKMVFGANRFPTIESAQAYVKNPEKLANYVYKNRLGNRFDWDGWRYRGGGLIQVTGRGNYEALGYGDNPEALRTPYVALKTAIAWWEGNVPDVFLNDVVRVSKRVNGGDNGLKHRTELYERIKWVIKK